MKFRPKALGNAWREESFNVWLFLVYPVGLHIDSSTCMNTVTNCLRQSVAARPRSDMAVSRFCLLLWSRPFLTVLVCWDQALALPMLPSPVLAQLWIWGLTMKTEPGLKSAADTGGRWPGGGSAPSRITRRTVADLARLWAIVIWSPILSFTSWAPTIYLKNLVGLHTTPTLEVRSFSKPQEPICGSHKRLSCRPDC